MRKAVKQLRKGYEGAQEFQERLELGAMQDSQVLEHYFMQRQQLREYMPTMFFNYDFRPVPEGAQAAAEWRRHNNEIARLWANKFRSEN